MAKIDDSVKKKVPELRFKGFKMIETRLPNMDEQKKIGAFFKQLDDTIALHQRNVLCYDNISIYFLLKYIFIL